MLPNVALSLWFISTKLKKKYCSNQNPTTFHTEYIRNIRNIRIYASSMKCIIQLLLFMSAFSHMEIINSARPFISLTVRFSKLSFSGYFPLFYQFQFKSWLESGWWEAQPTSVVLVTFIGSSLCIAAPDGSRKKNPWAELPPLLLLLRLCLLCTRVRISLSTAPLFSRPNTTQVGAGEENDKGSSSVILAKCASVQRPQSVSI